MGAPVSLGKPASTYNTQKKKKESPLWKVVYSKIEWATPFQRLQKRKVFNFLSWYIRKNNRWVNNLTKDLDKKKSSYYILPFLKIEGAFKYWTLVKLKFSQDLKKNPNFTLPLVE